MSFAVHARDVRRGRPAGHAVEHTGGRPGECLAALRAGSPPRSEPSAGLSPRECRVRRGSARARDTGCSGRTERRPLPRSSRRLPVQRRRGRRPRTPPHRRRPRGGDRRTTPGRGIAPPDVTTWVRSRSSVAGRRRAPRSTRAHSAAVTSDSDAPPRKARVRTRWRPMSRSPSLNQSSPPHAAADSSAFHDSSKRPQPRSGSISPESV